MVVDAVSSSLLLISSSVSVVLAVELLSKVLSGVPSRVLSDISSKVSFNVFSVMESAACSVGGVVVWLVVVTVMMGVIPGFRRRASWPDLHAMPGHAGVDSGFGGDHPTVRQACRADGGDARFGQVRTPVQHGSYKHIAGNAAQYVKMDV